ncbi:MAG: adenylate/guanylate cyclase domain-containing protein [Victivallales bacterium]|jgi:class 3 adenylate cyclase
MDNQAVQTANAIVSAKAETIDKITETVYNILKGKKLENIEIPPDYPNDEVRQLMEYVNLLVRDYNECTEFVYSIARGELDCATPKDKLVVTQSSKTLQASLRHLTLITQKVASGDFNHKVNFMGDFSLAFNSMTQQLKEAFDKIEMQKEILQMQSELILREKNQSEKLLLNTLPVKVVNELKEFGKSEPHLFENVTVFFSDIVGFTEKSNTLEPKVLISELNDIFTAFDEIVVGNGGERIKTIGDAYLCVCGMPIPDPNHAFNIVKSAVEMIDFIKGRNENSIHKWNIRVGINSGSVIGGIVGVRKYIYDVFGDAVNTASRMESNSSPMKINISESTYNLVKDSFEFTDRGEVEVKGKGKMRMFIK